ncbi:MAG: hypothetical protein ACRD2D_09760 [Terriglobales bacterium]
MIRVSLFATALLGTVLAWQSVPIVPMNVKVGYWENTSHITMSGSMGLPPEVAR